MILSFQCVFNVLKTSNSFFKNFLLSAVSYRMTLQVSTVSVLTLFQMCFKFVSFGDLSATEICIFIYLCLNQITLYHFSGSFSKACFQSSLLCSLNAGILH